VGLSPEIGGLAAAGRAVDAVERHRRPFYRGGGWGRCPRAAGGARG
jgi:hypothetical protein